MNPSDRSLGAPTVQRLEINQHGTTNTITSVAKDNYVVEPSGGGYTYQNINQKRIRYGS